MVHTIAHYAILTCWVILVLYWMANWSSVKPNQEDQSVSRRLRWVRYGIGILAALLLQFGEGIPVIGHRLAFLPRSSPALNVAVIILAVSGMVVAVMARRTLAGNWSGEVVVKKDHELIQTGVYAYARHPIYTGFLLLMLGTALLVGTPVAFMILIVMALGVRSKSRKEEILMIRCFPDQYPDYQARVKAIIPFIW